MQSLLQFLEIFKNDSYLNLIIGIASFIFGFFSLVFGLVSIIIALYFFKSATDSERRSSEMLSKISTKSDDLGEIATKLIVQLANFSTVGVKEYIENVLKITHKPIHPYPPIKETKQTDDQTIILIDTYIRYLYFLQKVNFYVKTSELATDDEMIEDIAKILDESYKEFHRTLELLEKYDSDKLKNSPNYELYVLLKSIKKDIRQGSFYLDIMRSIGRYPSKK